MPKLKRKITHIALVFVLAFAALSAKAQQAPIFTNYANSYSYVNAGFAGLSEGVNVLGLYRQQWAGFVDGDGNQVAPQTFLLTGDMPIRAIHGGIGLSILQDKIGFENNVNVGLGYSFHLDLGGSTLGIGLAGTLLNRSVDFGKVPERAGGVVDPLPADAPQFIKDYHAYYKMPRGYHPRSLNSTDGWNKTSALSFLNAKLLAYAGEIESAVMVLHGEKAHSRYFGETAFKMLKGGNKELVIVPGASHCDLYDQKDIIPFDRIAAFYAKYLK